MRKLRIRNKKKLVSIYRRRRAILDRYSVPKYAYGLCPGCNTFYDYWKYGETDFKCPSCQTTTLRELTPEELADALIDCEEDGCFKEEFAYSTPLMPVKKERHMECSCGWKGIPTEGEYPENDVNMLTTYWECPRCGSTLDAELSKKPHIL